MTTSIRCGVAAIGLFVAAAGIAAEKAAGVPKDAIDSLMTRLNDIGRDRDMTTAKKAAVAADELEKFNQQYKGKPLTVRLKIQDVVPYDQGHYLTANRPDLDGVQFYTGKFQSHLSSSEVLAITKDSVLAVTGMVSAEASRGRARQVVRHAQAGQQHCFSLARNSAWQICLDNVSYQLEAAPQAKPDARPAGPSGSGYALADKAKTEQVHGVDDIKLYFLKGLLRAQRQPGTAGTTAGGRSVPGQTPAPNTRYNPGYGPNSNTTPPPATTKHNRIYTAAEIIAKFGDPSSRSRKATAKEWVYKCKDGAVHLHFTQVGYSHGPAASKTETLKLEIKSVDSTAATGSRF